MQYHICKVNLVHETEDAAAKCAPLYSINWKESNLLLVI